MKATVEDLRQRGYLSGLDVELARTLGRIADETRAEVLLATACASREVRAGHVCLELSRLAAAAFLPGADEEPFPAPRWPALDEWRRALAASPLVGDGRDADSRPLVLDPAGRLYLQRYWRHQQRLAAALRELLAQGADDVDEPLLAAGLDRIFGTARDGSPGDSAREAAELAVRRRFTVVTGGPGTGKTWTVARILALLAQQLSARGRRLRATLLAPTGKAAMRLAEAIGKAKRDLSDKVDEAALAMVAEETSTIHRCLRPLGRSGSRFYHGPEAPLATDVVVVDEASMVDLALMSRLVAALPPRARLVLLGDADQLASVEAGSVLADLCQAGEGVVHLSRGHRFAGGGSIAALADAIRAGDADRVLDVLESGTYPEVERFEVDADRPGEAIRRAALAGYSPYLLEAAPEQRLDRFAAFRILCAHRRGPVGVEELNRFVEDALAEAGLVDPGPGETYLGRPIIVTRNDYDLELFNGDVGIVVEDEAEPGRRRVLFGSGRGRARRISPARLPPHETVYAMSVHKSQGSEFGSIAILLGDARSPLLTRELLYTAVTRARERVSIHASREAIAEAVRRPVRRASGLRDALRA